MKLQTLILTLISLALHATLIWGLWAAAFPWLPPLTWTGALALRLLLIFALPSNYLTPPPRHDP